jgi:hypothetical protein
MQPRAPKQGSLSPSRRALARLESRLSGQMHDEASGARRPAGPRVALVLGGVLLLLVWFAVTVLAVTASEPRAPGSITPPDGVQSAMPYAEDGALPLEAAWESSDSVALVSSLPSAAPGAHASERCLPIQDESAARCYRRLAPRPPPDERVLRNLVIALRILGDWDSTSHLAASYWRRYPRSPFLSGIRPLVFGPDTRTRPMIPPGLTPASWTDRLTDLVHAEGDAVLGRLTRAE